MALPVAFLLHAPLMPRWLWALHKDHKTLCSHYDEWAPCTPPVSAALLHHLCVLLPLPFIGLLNLLLPGHCELQLDHLSRCFKDQQDVWSKFGLKTMVVKGIWVRVSRSTFICYWWAVPRKPARAFGCGFGCCPTLTNLMFLSWQLDIECWLK